MNIALLCRDKGEANSIKDAISNEFKVFVFFRKFELLKEIKLKKFDLLLWDCSVLDEKVCSLLESKNVNLGLFDFKNEYKNGFCDKALFVANSLESLSNNIKYFEVKERIRDLSQKEEEFIEEFRTSEIPVKLSKFKEENIENKCFEIDRKGEEIAVVTLTDCMSLKKKELLNELKGISKIVLYFNEDILTSKYLGFIVNLYKSVNSKNIELYYLSKKEDISVDLIKACNLDKFGIIKIINSVGDIK